MENASKALVMAGGILIAIMVLATLMFMVQNTASYKSEMEEQQMLQQITNFNKEYESYQKSLLRGTELITVINKAIANNTKYEEQDKVYDINIKFKLVTPVQKTTVTIKNGVKSKTRSEEEMGAAKEYSIVDDRASDRINSEIKNFINVGSLYASKDYIITNYIDANNYTMEYNGFTDFKRKIFKCTNIHYNDITKRVDLLEFEEVKLTEDTSAYY